MAVFTILMAHPDGEGWGAHLRSHVAYLEKLLADGRLKASGPLRGTRLRSGFLIVEAQSRAEVEQLVANDPYALAGLICELTISEWDPVFGAFHDLSSRQLPGGLGAMR